ncbi:MAG: sensor histidine kinase [Actinobacteria bacterium]|nr:MAG: sensor histidine kinase [Actinomycetota bacterium]
MILSVVLAITTYGFTRTSFIQQRQTTQINQAFANAKRVQFDLITNPTYAISALQQFGSAQRVLFKNGVWTSAGSGFTQADLPSVLKTRVITNLTSAHMLIHYKGNTAFVIGIPLEKVDATYFELESLRETDDALRSVFIALMFSGAITTAVGIGLGLFVSGRTVRPLVKAAQAAKAIAEGRLDTRLEPTEDRDLQALTTAFNDMVETLQIRVERDARFTSDVSHELRSPLMTLAASAQVMQSRRGELPERSQAALDLLIGDVSRFQGLVEDLLEISRFDAGVIRLIKEPLVLLEFVRQAIAVSSLPRTEVQCPSQLEQTMIQGDKRRLARVIANLIDNARIHSGGKPEVIIMLATDDQSSSTIWVIVQDDGGGLIDGEEERIFERFSRGGAAGQRAGSEGAGLGLALAAEHVELHSGSIWAENRSDGIRGARFIIELSISKPLADTPTQQQMEIGTP